MLNLDRKIGQSIVINGNIKVTYLGRDYRGDVRLGIEAPKDVPIHREEIQRRIDKTK